MKNYEVFKGFRTITNEVQAMLGQVMDKSGICSILSPFFGGSYIVVTFYVVFTQNTIFEK